MSELGELEICLPHGTATELLHVASQEGLLPETVLTAAWVLLLYRYTEDDTVMLGTAVPPIPIPGQMEARHWLRTIPNATGVIACELGGSLVVVKIQYSTTLFGENSLPQISQYLIRLIDEICSHLGDPVSSIDILPEEEKRRLLVDWNQTAAAYPAHQCVHEQFEMQVVHTPDAIALVFQNQCLTYRALNEEANRLARRLVSLGVGPGSLVGISLERSIEMMVGLLAILKAGGAYLPLDPTYPPQRLKAIFADAQPLVVLTQERIASQLHAEARVLCVDSEKAVISLESPEPLGPRATAEDLVYVIYTSGSTGKPKGAMIEHRNVVSFFTAMDHAIGDSVPGVWLALTSIAFDISVLELFWTLTRGFKVILQGDDGPRSAGDDYSIARNTRTHGVTHLQCTPSLARMLMADQESVQALAGLQKLFLGGETLPTSLAEQARRVISGRVYNMYGPTETTIWSTTHLVEETRNAIPIGRPIANTQVYILDQRRRPVPTGATGELYISGAGVVRGYLNRPDLTAERFLANPFSGDPVARMYKTGDLARYLPNGNIEYLGRADFQVKIRGHRIELGEIEVVLERHPGVTEAVVTAREGKAGDKRLVAYVVLDADAPPGSGVLRSYLRDTLPEYMQPAAFVALEAMPLTANGKIDRNALPVPEGREISLDSVYAPPETDLQESIVEIWREALNVDQIGIHDNFFDLGAHSLLIAEVHVRLQELLRKEVPLVTMFRYPTVAALVGYLSQNSSESHSLGRSANRAQARRESIQRRSGYQVVDRL